MEIGIGVMTFHRTYPMPNVTPDMESNKAANPSEGPITRMPATMIPRQ